MLFWTKKFWNPCIQGVLWIFMTNAYYEKALNTFQTFCIRSSLPLSFIIHELFQSTRIVLSAAPLGCPGSPRGSRKTSPVGKQRPRLWRVLRTKRCQSQKCHLPFPDSRTTPYIPKCCCFLTWLGKEPRIRDDQQWPLGRGSFLQIVFDWEQPRPLG